MHIDVSRASLDILETTAMGARANTKIIFLVVENCTMRSFITCTLLQV
jgi:hypothetical protein